MIRVKGHGQSRPRSRNRRQDHHRNSLAPLPKVGWRPSVREQRHQTHIRRARKNTPNGWKVTWTHSKGRMTGWVRTSPNLTRVKAHHPVASGAFAYLPISTAASCLLSHHQTVTALVVSADIGAAMASTFRRGSRNATTALVRAPIRICDTPITADAMPA